MAIRYSGHVKITLRLMLSVGHHGRRYRVGFSKRGVTFRPDRSVVFVGLPAHLSHAIDSAEAYDDAARAGISFFLDEERERAHQRFDEGDFEWGDAGAVVRTSPLPGTVWHQQQQADEARGAERKGNPARSEVDDTAATELRLFLDNEGKLYEKKLAIVENLKKKKRAGTYDPTLAPKLWLFLVDEAAKMYAKEFASPGEWATIFTRATRMEVAREVAEDEGRKIDEGYYGAAHDAPRGVLGTLPREGNPSTREPTMAQAVAAYRIGNDAGAGYAPYRDEPGEDTIDNAVEAAERDGWELVLSRRTSDDVALLRNADGEWMAIGGDGMGRNAWAVDVSTALGSERRGNPVDDGDLDTLLEKAKTSLDNGNAWNGEYRGLRLWLGEPSGSRRGEYEGQILGGGRAVEVGSKSWPVFKVKFKNAFRELYEPRQGNPAGQINDRRRDPSHQPRGFVVMRDKFMSGWGKAPGNSYYAIAVETENEGYVVIANAADRSEMKNVRWSRTLPRIRANDHLSVTDRHEAPRWFVPGAFKSDEE